MKTMLLNTVLAAALVFGATKNDTFAKPVKLETNASKIKNGMRLSESLKMNIVKEEVKVEFSLNTKNEVEIKSISTNNNEIKKFVAQKFAKLSFNDLEQGKNYFVNIIYKVY